VLVKRWWFVCVVLFLLFGLSATALICLLQTRVTEANYDRIQDGMTLAEVEEILGKALMKGRCISTYGLTAPTGLTFVSSTAERLSSSAALEAIQKSYAGMRAVGSAGSVLYRK
jgi:hypothetical protein